MAKKHKHEDHVNHEAWAIPYGDLVTLLFALFTVMYAVSSVNEGKFRQAATSMAVALDGPAQSAPVKIGEEAPANQSVARMEVVSRPQPPQPALAVSLAPTDPETRRSMEQMSLAIRKALSGLIAAKVVSVRHAGVGLEVEIQTDILFPSGTATLSPAAQQIMTRLAEALKAFDNPVSVEGHTDNQPIQSPQFPSNWELSAARAASVVHLLMHSGLDPARLSVIGAGEYKPVGDNATETGRNHNRRVVLVIPAIAAQAVRKSSEQGARTHPVTPPTETLPP